MTDILMLPEVGKGSRGNLAKIYLMLKDSKG